THIIGQDDPEVGIAVGQDEAQINDGRAEHGAEEEAGAQVFTDDDLPKGEGRGLQQFGRAALLLLGPEPHGDAGRKEKQYKYGVLKDMDNTGLLTIKDQIKEETRDQEEGRQDDIADGRGEIIAQFLTGDGPDLATVHWDPSLVVNFKKTSSRLRPTGES